MEELEERLHHTWLDLLLAYGYNEVGAMVVDGQIKIEWSNSLNQRVIFVEIPALFFPPIINDSNLSNIIETTIKQVLKGHIHGDYNDALSDDKIIVNYRAKLVDVETDWQQKVKELIANAKDSNQGIITEIVFARDNNKSTYLYNEMKFGSRSEIRIAQELEKRQVLFFPLPLAIRSDTGQFYRDHREPDFLVCNDGVWGILEVSHHSSERYEKDVEKDAWFKQSGILCIEHRTADRCFNQPNEVVEEFLTILAKHKRQ